MSQGRTQNQIETTNKMMVTFLIAIIMFIFFTYTFSLIETKTVWVKKIQREFLAGTK